MRTLSRSSCPDIERFYPNLDLHDKISDRRLDPGATRAGCGYPDLVARAMCREDRRESIASVGKRTKVEAPLGMDSFEACPDITHASAAPRASLNLSKASRMRIFSFVVASKGESCAPRQFFFFATEDNSARGTCRFFITTNRARIPGRRRWVTHDPAKRARSRFCCEKTRSALVAFDRSRKPANSKVVETLPRFTKNVRAELEARRSLLARRPFPVIDGDAHVTDIRALRGSVSAAYRATSNYYHGRPISADELVAEMDMAEVDLALIWQNPAATERGKNRSRNAAALLAANRYILASARKFPHRLIPAGWIDPAGLGLPAALSMTDTLVKELGFLVVKMNPAQNRFPIDSAEVFAVVERIVSHGAIPAFHFGGDTSFTPARGLARLASRFAPHRIIAVHMGGGGSSYDEGEALYQEARELGLKNPNLFFIQSAKRDCHIESDFIAYQLAGSPFCHNIAVGSDAPYGRLSWNFGGYRAMFASLRDRRHPDERLAAQPNLFKRAAETNFMGGNLANLLADGYAAWLA